MATPPNCQSPLDSLNAYGRRVWQMPLHGDKRPRLVTKWQCNICTFENDMQFTSCQMCEQNRRENNTMATNVRMTNPYFRGGGVLNMPPLVSQYPSYPSYPSHASYPSNTAVYQDQNKQQQQQQQQQQQKQQKQQHLHSNLHPTLLQHMNGSVNDFKKAVASIGVTSSTNTKEIEYTDANILGAQDWLVIPTTQLLDNFGKTFSMKDVDRLYFGLQKYIKEYPDGPWKGESFWSKVAAYTNSTRKWSSWKNHYNDYTKDDKKGKYRWNQLNAIKALIRKNRSKQSVHSQVSALKHWADTEKKKQDAAKAKKDQVEADAVKHKHKLGMLLDLALDEQKQTKIKAIAAAQSTNNNDPQFTPPLIPHPIPARIHQLRLSHQLNLPTITSPQQKSSLNTSFGSLNQSQKLSHPIIASKPTHIASFGAENDDIYGMNCAKNKDNKDESYETLITIKDMIDDIEDTGVEDSTQLDELKQILYLDSDTRERSTIVEEFTRLDGKYYGESEKIIKKLLKIHKMFNK